MKKKKTSPKYVYIVTDMQYLLTCKVSGDGHFPVSVSGYLLTRLRASSPCLHPCGLP